MRLLTLLAALAFTIPATAQDNIPTATSAADRMAGYELRKEIQKNSQINNLQFDNIGPTIFSGRVNDVAVHPEDPSIFYTAYASGGLWLTENNGNSFTPLFDHESVMTIGDIAVDWDNDIIWIGSGENNSSRSSYAGDGMYKSTDGGETWEHKGLEESHHIGRIILHPDNPNTLWVAVLGHLYSENPERGIYKTTDGGDSWQQVLFVNNNTGAIDMVIDPNDPNTLYAASWERSRRAWNFQESGAGSGIYKSTDGGNSWVLMTSEKSGFPVGEGVGRIGLDICSVGNKTYIYAVLDNYFRREAEETTSDDESLTKVELREMSDTEFASIDDDKLTAYLEDNGFPEEYTAEVVKEKVANNEIEPKALVEYLEDANSLLFDTDVIGAEVYVSTDDGKSWDRTHEGYIDGLFYTYGYYFAQIRVDPTNSDKLYILGVPVLRSDDGGKNWTSINGDNVHSDHHALWVNPERKGHLILGNDGGINISYDDGETWFKCNSPSVGQFYSVHLDRATPYRVYGGLQDNGVWGGNNTYRFSNRWHSSGRYPYQSYMGGDGMQVQIDYRDNNTMYTGFQFGNYFRVDMTSGDREYITPRHELGQRPFRWNWQAPILLSRHQEDIVYFGSNFLHRSFDQGDNFSIISPDLTKGGIKGDVPYGTIATIHESPLRFGLIYAGSDDGLIHVTKDMGANWDRISDNLPQDLWVSRVQASSHMEGRVYCSLNGYRWDDFTAYVYVSEDYGMTWTSISDGLPAEPVNVIKEDPVNPDVLYVGTDHGIYISIDRGKTYHSAGQSVPAVAVHDLEIHPEEGHLVLGTHGRSFYRADISPIQMMTPEFMSSDIAFYESNGTVRHSSRWGTRRSDWSDYYEPEYSTLYYSSENQNIKWELISEDVTVATGELEAEKGINSIEYDLTGDPQALESIANKAEGDDKPEVKPSDNGQVYLIPGKYTLKITSGDSSSEQVLTLK